MLYQVHLPVLLKGLFWYDRKMFISFGQVTVRVYNPFLHSFLLSLYLQEETSIPTFHRAPNMLWILRKVEGLQEFEKSVEVRQRGCLILRWRRLRHGSPCHSCVLCDCRWCSNPAPRWWRKLCRRLSAGHLSGFLCCCQTGYDIGSSAASELLGPNRKKNISDIKENAWKELT